MNVFFALIISACTAGAVFFLFVPTLRLWDAAATQLIVDLKRSLVQLGFDEKPIYAYMRLWGVVLTIVISCGFALGVPILAGIVAFVIFVAPREILKIVLRSRKRLLKDQLIVALNLINNAIHTGIPVEQTVKIAAEETSKPLKLELNRIVVEYERGRTIEDALNASKDRLQLQEFAVFVTALVVNKKSGGNLKQTLKEIQNTLFENRRLERKLEADTASGRMVINVLCLAPILFLFGGYGLNPEGTALMFTTLWGQLILLCSVVLIYAGYYLGQKVVNVEF